VRTHLKVDEANGGLLEGRLFEQPWSHLQAGEIDLAQMWGETYRAAKQSRKTRQDTSTLRWEEIKGFV